MAKHKNKKAKSSKGSKMLARHLFSPPGAPPHTVPLPGTPNTLKTAAVSGSGYIATDFHDTSMQRMYGRVDTSDHILELVPEPTKPIDCEVVTKGKNSVHAYFFPILQTMLARHVPEGWEVVLDSKNWLILRSLTQDVAIEFQCEGGTGEFKPFTKHAKVTSVPGSNLFSNQPDGVISILYASGLRVPVWYFDLKFRQSVTSHQAQALQYATDGWLYLATLGISSAVRTTVISYFPSGMSTATWRVDEEKGNPFLLQARPVLPPSDPRSMQPMIESILNWCCGLALTKEFLAVDKSLPPACLHPFTPAQLEHYCGEGVVPSQLSSSRHALYERGPYVFKLVINDFERDNQNAMYTHMRKEMIKMGYPDVMPEREEIRLSPQFVLERTVKVGKTGLKDFNGYSEKPMSKVLGGLVALTTLASGNFNPPDGPKIPFVHGDLRAPNIDENGIVLDFEFLGKNCSRSQDAIEICQEQYSSNYPTAATALWQLGVLLMKVLVPRAATTPVFGAGAPFEWDWSFIPLMKIIPGGRAAEFNAKIEELLYLLVTQKIYTSHKSSVEAALMELPKFEAYFKARAK